MKKSVISIALIMMFVVKSLTTLWHSLGEIVMMFACGSSLFHIFFIKNLWLESSLNTHFIFIVMTSIDIDFLSFLQFELFL